MSTFLQQLSISISLVIKNISGTTAVMIFKLMTLILHEVFVSHFDLHVQSTPVITKTDITKFRLQQKKSSVPAKMCTFLWEKILLQRKRLQRNFGYNKRILQPHCDKYHCLQPIYNEQFSCFCAVPIKFTL